MTAADHLDRQDGIIFSGNGFIIRSVGNHYLIETSEGKVTAADNVATDILDELLIVRKPLARGDLRERCIECSEKNEQIMEALRRKNTMLSQERDAWQRRCELGPSSRP